MKSWNVHSWYITGILTFLLIVSIALQWDRIPNLPGVISFALGLASLLLAIIAIIQALGGSSDVHAGLSSIRTAADEIRSLADRISGESGKVADTSQRLVDALTGQQARAEKQDKSSQNLHTVGSMSKLDQLAPKLSYGAALTLYGFALSVKTGMPIDFGEIFDHSITGSFCDGYATGLLDTDYVEGKKVGTAIQITNLTSPSTSLMSTIENFDYASNAEDFKRDLQKLSNHFDV